MRRIDALILRIRSLFRGTRVERELDDELRFHVEEHTRELTARGMSPADARTAALRAFGGLEQIKESVRDTWHVRLAGDLAQDLRYAARTLRHAPTFTVVAALTITLGIGATTAIFSVVDGVLLKPLNYPNPDRIVRLLTHWTKTGHNGGNLAGGDLVEARDHAGIFEAFSRFNGDETAVRIGDRTELVGTWSVNTQFFHVFGVQPVAGRWFRRDDVHKAAVTSLGFATQRFGSASAALGRTFVVGTLVYQIVGVMPAGFHFPQLADIWLAAADQPENMNHSGHNYPVVARLRPGVPRETVDAAMATVTRRLSQSFPDFNFSDPKTLIAMPLQEYLVGSMRGTLYLLLGAVALLFLIACANVANLLLARATVRSREIALRAALGANRWRIVRQLVVESLMLAAVGGGTGLAIAYLGTPFLVRMAPVDLPRLDEIVVDRAVLGFAVLVSILASLVFGLVPAWQASRVDLRERLVEGGAHGSIGAASNRLRTCLAVAEIALAVVLTVGGGLLFRSFVALSTTELGYRTTNMTIVKASIPTEDGIPAARRTVERFERLLPALATVSGVESAAAAVGSPMGMYGSNGSFAVEGRHIFAPGQKLPWANFRLASPGYFKTMGIPLKRGRDFTPRDSYDTPFVVIVSEALVREVFPNEDPIGHRIQCGYDSMNFMTVIGVVADIRESPGLAPVGELFMPIAQHPLPATQIDLIIRSAMSPAALVPTLRERIRQADPEIATKFSSFEARTSDSVSAPRFRTWLVGTFAALALLLAVAGIYGLLTYLTAQRTPELGVRMALGAGRGRVIGLVLSRAAVIAAAGLAIGAVLAVAATGLMRSMMFGTEPLDPVTYAGVVVAVLAVTLAAAAVPAWRASRIDPVRVLREQ
jgi:putative ABC transport system permease protein